VDRPEDRPKPPVKLSGSGKKFSVTVQVPEDVAARWPEWFTTEKLMGEAFKAAEIAGGPGRSRAASRLVTVAAVVLLVELFVAGLVVGFIGASRLRSRAVSEPPAPPAAVPAEAGAPSAGTGLAGAETPPQVAELPAPATAEMPAASPPQTRPAAQPARAYRVQVGAFRVRANAEAVMDRLNRDGYRPALRTYGGLFLVQVGSFASRSEAEALAAKLKALRYDVLIVP